MNQDKLTLNYVTLSQKQASDSMHVFVENDEQSIDDKCFESDAGFTLE